MIWELKRDLILSDDDDVNFEGSLEKNLAKVSTREIENLSNRIHFYMAHFKIMSDNPEDSASSSKKKQIKRLEKIKNILKNEIELRKNKIHL